MQAPRTHVGRIERVRAQDADSDRYFSLVYGLQLSINESEHVKIDSISRLARAFGLAEGADLERCAASVRDWSNELAAQNLHVSVQIDPGHPLALPEPMVLSGSAAPAVASSVPTASPFETVPEEFPETQDVAERQVSVEFRVAGGAMPASSEPRARAVRAAIRTLLALKRRMDAINTFAAALRTAGRTIETRARSRGAPHSLDAEFRDAANFLEGASGRAMAQSQAAFQAAVRLQASANPTATTE